ncbi:T. brucei spp.-specific protein [Trypanosoma brucei gambiense DAL972]|uniref:T. brucei spp.-specific protein n=1 Tax=Trypanosoma brucei gambiense (strain MHOM/CI/86/DAL972) TaxID=679716 RepID=C9ZM25_TRYB9|nr:T. brucei spp.-specific protein [Trypanosoma brucei gambiense DAL972]CBH10450.1 T. brucei spp.-specific protein [Trypanosoma brucei gambiense DAL972]|eukprot:XP_011772740.1 T. brucei spp.-specific protein [Trypanosoma brucei gambiense DAL972]
MRKKRKKEGSVWRRIIKFYNFYCYYYYYYPPPPCVYGSVFFFFMCVRVCVCLLSHHMYARSSPNETVVDILSFHYFPSFCFLFFFFFVFVFPTSRVYCTLAMRLVL